RSFTAPSSSRSRDSVACVTSIPSAASSAASSLWLRTSADDRVATMRACRTARVTSDVVFEPLWVIAPLLLIASLCIVAGAASFRPLQKPHQQRLLRMQPILGLVPDRAVRPVDHVVGDLV